MLRKITTIGWAAAAAFALFGLSACDDVSGPADGSSRLSVLLTDAPGDVDSAWVQITEVRLQGETEGDATFEVPAENQWQELTSLANDGNGEQLTADLVRSEEIPAGSYGQLRLMIGSAVLKAETSSPSPQAPSVPEVFVMGEPDWDQIAGLDGTEESGRLMCPSCPQTGIKVNLPDGGLALEGGETGLVLDFDVAQSFGRQAGASGMWVMKPTITSSTLAVGSIAGTVTIDTADGTGHLQACGENDADDLTAFVPTAAMGDDTKTASVNGDGEYRISFLTPGDWTMGFEGETTFDGEKLVFEEGDVEVGSSTVTVQEGSTATVDYAITDTVACESASSGG